MRKFKFTGNPSEYGLLEGKSKVERNNIYDENYIPWTPFFLTPTNSNNDVLSSATILYPNDWEESAYNVIKNRTGKTVGGTFIKD